MAVCVCLQSDTLGLLLPQLHAPKPAVSYKTITVFENYAEKQSIPFL